MHGRQRGVLPLPQPRLGPLHRLDLPRFHLHYVRPQVDARYAVDPLGFEAPVVDPDVQPGPLQRLVGLLRPRFAGLQQPGFRLQRPALARAPQLRVRRVVALEPLLFVALQPVVAPFAYHQVTVRVLAGTGMDRQRVGQVLGGGQIVGKPDRQLLPLVGGQGQGQGKFHPLKELPVPPLPQVRRVPIGRRLRLRPARHVAGFRVDQLGHGLGIPAVLRCPLDVGGCRPGAVALRPRTVADVQMVDAPTAAASWTAAPVRGVEAGEGVVVGSHGRPSARGQKKRGGRANGADKHRVSRRETHKCALSSFGDGNIFTHMIGS